MKTQATDMPSGPLKPKVGQAPRVPAFKMEKGVKYRDSKPGRGMLSHGAHKGAIILVK